MRTNQEVLAVLTNAAASTQPVAVELRDGQRFRDGVCEVFLSCGADFVTFYAHNRMMVDDITRCEAIARQAGADA
jgi:hypothetical protein